MTTPTGEGGLVLIALLHYTDLNTVEAVGRDGVTRIQEVGCWDKNEVLCYQVWKHGELYRVYPWVHVIPEYATPHADAAESSAS